MAGRKQSSGSLDAINAIRDRLSDLERARADLLAMPRSDIDIKADIQAAVQAELPVFSGSSGFDRDWLVSDPSSFGGFGRAFQLSPVGALALLLGTDAVVEGFQRHAVAAIADQGKTITDNDRAALLAISDADIDDACREEERLCRDAERLGFEIDRRVDAPALYLIVDDSELEGRR